MEGIALERRGEDKTKMKKHKLIIFKSFKEYKNILIEPFCYLLVVSISSQKAIFFISDFKTIFGKKLK